MTDRKRHCRAIAERLIGNRRFAGTIVIDKKTGRQSDDHRIQDLLENERGGFEHNIKPWWQAYWSDGSAKEDRLGVSVVNITDLSKTEIGWDIQSKSKFWHFRRFSGKSTDAELYGIAAALGMALAEYHHGHEWLRTVRVYTDAESILRALEKSTCRVLGPINTHTDPLAIQLVYDRAEGLQRLGINVELHWVKAHALSYLNGLADRQARWAAECPPPGTQSPQDARFEMWAQVPQAILAKGPDVVREWRARGNHLDGESEDEPMDEGDSASEDD